MCKQGSTEYELKSENKHQVNRVQAFIFLSGLFISAFGSMTYAATLPVLLLQSGASAAYIGALIGVLRGVAFVVNMFLGRIGDIVSPRRVIVICELGAAIGSLTIFLSWQEYQSSWLLPFFIANILRLFFTALQGASSQKYGKIFDEQLVWGGKMAVLMNGVTNGALLVGGTLSLLFFEHLSIELIVILDLVSFLINGAFVFCLPATNVTKSSRSVFAGPVEISVAAYYKLQPKLAYLDICLALAFCGANTLNIRLLAGHPEWVPILPAIFGAMAFITSFFTTKLPKPSARVLWLTLAVMLLAQGLLHKYPVIIVALSAVQSLFYWIVFHGISRDFMLNIPMGSYAGVAAGRNALTVGVLASGELWVGLTRNINLIIELGWRAIVATFPIFKSSERK